MVSCFCIAQKQQGVADAMIEAIYSLGAITFFICHDKLARA